MNRVVLINLPIKLHINCIISKRLKFPFFFIFYFLKNFTFLLIKIKKAIAFLIFLLSLLSIYSNFTKTINFRNLLIN